MTRSEAGGLIEATGQAAASGRADLAEQGSKGVAAVDRALGIVAALEASPEPATLTEISRATGFHKSTVLRLLETLQAHGYVMRMLENRYALGPALFRLGKTYEARTPLRTHVLPVLQSLVDAGLDSPSFHVRQNADERVCLFRLDAHFSTLDRVQVGDSLPLARGAAGRVILAHDEATATDGTREAEDAAQIRRDRFAVSLGERDPLCAGAAAPVFSADGGFIGALSISGPRDRFGPEDIARIKPALLLAASAITRALGGQ